MDRKREIRKLWQTARLRRLRRTKPSLGKRQWLEIVRQWWLMMVPKLLSLRKASPQTILRLLWPLMAAKERRPLMLFQRLLKPRLMARILKPMNQAPLMTTPLLLTTNSRSSRLPRPAHDLLQQAAAVKKLPSTPRRSLTPVKSPKR